MRYPPRLSHLVTRSVLVAKLAPGYAEVHQLGDEESVERVARALNDVALLENLLAGTWAAMRGETERLNEDGLLEKVARSLRDRPMRPAKPPPETPAWSAFWLQLDVAAGTATEAIRRVLETEAAKKMASAGFETAYAFLAKELTRGR